MNTNQLQEYFLKTLNESGLEGLSNPRTFTMMLSDVSKGNIQNAKMIYDLLEESVLPSFKRDDLLTEESVDRTCKEAYDRVCDAFPVSEECAQGICVAFANAVKQYKGMPIRCEPQSTVSKPQQKNDPLVQTILSGFENIPPENGSAKKKKTSIMIAVAVLLTLIAVAVGVHLFRNQAGTRSGSMGNVIEKKDDAHDTVCAADLIGMRMEDIVNLLGDDYEPYSYTGGFYMNYEKYGILVLVGWQVDFMDEDYHPNAVASQVECFGPMPVIGDVPAAVTYEELIQAMPEAANVQPESYENLLEGVYETQVEIETKGYSITYIWQDPDQYPDISEKQSFAIVQNVR